MKCPHCGGDIEQADSNGQATLGLGPETVPERAGNPRPAAKASRRSALPADWLPTPELEKYCRQQGRVVSDCLQAFREYYLAKGTVWKDWGLVWMKWCREWEPKTHKAAQGQISLHGEPWEQRLKGYAPGKYWSPMWGPKPHEPGCRVPKELLPID